MEFSPLKFLDFDASQMLADQVRISQEEEARRFHYNLYTFESVHTSTIPGYHYRDHNIICRAFAGIAIYWDPFWDEELSGKGHSYGTIKQRIMMYEQELIIPTKPLYVFKNTRGNSISR